MHINKHAMWLFLSFCSNSFIVNRGIRWIVILTFVFRCVFMWLLSLSVLREVNTIRGNWNNIPDLPKTNPSSTPPPGESPRLSNWGLLTLSQTSSGPVLWWAANNISPWPDEVVRPKVERLKVEGVAKVGKEGSVCQAAGWGYPWLAALPLCPPSSITVNEIHRLTTGRHTMERKKDGELNCLFIFYQPVFTFSTPFPPSSFILKWKYISTPVLWPKPVPPCLFFPLWHSIFAFSSLLKLLLHFLFNSLYPLLFNSHWRKHPSPAVLHTQSGHQPRYFYCAAVCVCVWHTCRGDHFTLCMLRGAAPCVIELWRYSNRQTATFCEVLFAHTDVCLFLSWENAAVCSHFHTSGWVILTQQPPVTHFPLVVWPFK